MTAVQNKETRADRPDERTLHVLAVHPNPAMQPGIRRVLRSFKAAIPDIGAEIVFTIEIFGVLREAIERMASASPDILLIEHQESDPNAFALPLELPDSLLGDYSGAGVIFGLSGCIGGGGQSWNVSDHVRTLRAGGLLKEDRVQAVRTSYENPHIQQLYKEFLGAPLGKNSQALLHTRYKSRPEYLR